MPKTGSCSTSDTVRRSVTTGPRADARALERLVAQVRNCRICRDSPTCGAPLPHEPKPVLRVATTARLAVFGQAPGTRVHASGVPFSDPSGVRLRGWMGVSEEQFYDVSRIVILPMGFCFPGLDDTGGDLPPRRECAPLWHDRLLEQMPRIELTLLVGGYAQAHYLRDAGHASVSMTTRDWRTHAPRILPLPHPSPRNVAWFKANAWFEGELLPVLRRRVRRLVGD